MNNLNLDIEITKNEENHVVVFPYNQISKYFVVCEKNKIDNLILEKSKSELEIIYEKIDNLFKEFQTSENYNIILPYLNHKNNLEKEIIKVDVFISDLINKIEEDNKKNNVPLIS